MPLSWMLPVLFASPVFSQTPPTTLDWPVYGGNVQGWHYSPDSRINPKSIEQSGGLMLKWSYQDIPRIEGDSFQRRADRCKDRFVETMQDTPQVVNGQLFVATWHDLYAFKAKPAPGITVQPQWTYPLLSETYSCNGPTWSGPRLAASATNRGVAIDHGVLYVNSLDAHLIALTDLKKPKPDLLLGFPVNLLDLRNHAGQSLTAIPREQFQSYSTPAAPTVYDGKVIVGVAGGDGVENGFVQGFVAAVDAHRPEGKWVFCTVPGLKSDVASNGNLTAIGCNDQQSQPGTWPDNPTGSAGGGAVWVTPTIDPSHGMVLFGTGNPIGSRKTVLGRVRRSGYIGDDRAGTNLFSDSIVALDLHGNLKSFYQEVHHDLWDYDQASPIIAISDHGINILGAAGKTGWWYQFKAQKFAVNDPSSQMFTLAGNRESVVPSNAANQQTWKAQPILDEAYDFTTSRMNMFAPPAKPTLGSEPICISPGTYGGAEWGPITYERQAGRIYLIDVEEPTSFASTAEGAHRPPCKDPGIKQSFIRAVDPRSGKVIPKLTSEDLGEYPGGLLSTAGGLIFVGTRDGLLRAYDTSLKLVWRGCVEDPAKTTGCQYMIIAAPMAFTIDRTQYIAITGNSIKSATNAVFVLGLKGK